MWPLRDEKHGHSSQGQDGHWKGTRALGVGEVGGHALLQELFLFHLQHLSSGKLALVFPQGSMWDLGRRAEESISLEFRKEKYTIELENLIAGTTALGVKGGLCNDAVQEVQPGADKDSKTNSSCPAKQRLKSSAFLTRYFQWRHNVLEPSVGEKSCISGVHGSLWGTGQVILTS